MCRHSKPFEVRPGFVIPTSCSYCSDCYRKKSLGWQARVHYESLDNRPRYVFTLTYKDDPFLLCYRDVQLFHKRMRRYGFKFRYFASGEYGGRKGRPHYHAMYFGIDEITDLELYEFKQNGIHIYMSSVINKLWTHGFVFIQHCTDEAGSVRYLTKYFSKDVWQLSPVALKHFMILFGIDEVDYLVPKCRICIYRYPKVLNALTDTVKEKYVDDLGFIDFKLLVRILTAPYRPKHLHSLSIGYNSWVKRIDRYVELGGVYIDGLKVNVPMCWLRKYLAPLFASTKLMEYCYPGDGKEYDPGMFLITHPEVMRDLNKEVLPHSDYLYAEYLALVADMDIDEILLKSSVKHDTERDIIKKHDVSLEKF